MGLSSSEFCYQKKICGVISDGTGTQLNSSKVKEFKIWNNKNAWIIRWILSSVGSHFSLNPPDTTAQDVSDDDARSLVRIWK